VIPLLYLLLTADFSHQPHLTTAKLKCLDCHTAPAKFGDRVAHPAVAKCALCHPKIDKNMQIPSKITVKLADYVYFDHRFHLMNAIKCEDCHGEDAGRAEVVKMSFCQPCHIKTKAPARCNTCHDTR
jgi:hypothetical protein